MRADCQIYRDSGAGTTYSDQGYVREAIVSENTPFFHVDLIAAVRVAEKVGLEEEGEESEGGENRPNATSQNDILIDLHN